MNQMQWKSSQALKIPVPIATDWAWLNARRGDRCKNKVEAPEHEVLILNPTWLVNGT